MLSPSTTPSLAVMRNAVMPYDWGSRHRLAALQGRQPSACPEAELWMGAHPRAASRLVDADGRELALSTVLSSRPDLLGEEVLTAFGPRLPFLVKILAIDRVLSVQVHPDATQAAAGHAAEERAGLAQDPALRSFPDPHAKPEQIVALTPVDALAGLRPPRQARHLLGLLRGLRDLEAVEEALACGDVPAALAAAGQALPDGAAFVAEAVDRAVDCLSWPAVQRDAQAWDALCWLVRIAVQFPQDPLVIAPLLLRLHHLAPGQSLLIQPGTPHAYLQGLAIEAMGASDNVARAGLTSKKVDQDLVGLLARAHPVHVAAPVASQAAPGWRTWPSGVREFRLHHATLGQRGLQGPAARPAVVVCTRGTLRVRVGGHEARLDAGTSAFVAATRGPRPPMLQVVGPGEAYVVTPGLDGQ